MGILRDSMKREGRSPEPPRPGAGQAPAESPPPASAVQTPDAAGQADSPYASFAPAPRPGSGGSQASSGATDARSELRQRRDALAEQVAEMHWDLGGLAYEMAIRDHFRLDVLVRRAAALQERDAELAEVERMLRSEEEGIAGECPACGAPHSRGAVYCWQCGATLMRVASSAALGEQPTAALDSLPAAAWEEHRAHDAG